MIITIDGPSGTGKSSTAKGIAKALGFVHFDTGAMYRAITYLVMKEHVDTTDPVDLEALLGRFSFHIKLQEGVKRFFVDGEDVTEVIRSREVTARVSEISAIPRVREKMVLIQQQVGHETDSVFEGRDLGTVVFPDAQVKIYLTASPEVRAGRRHLEIGDPSISKESIQKELEERDQIDMTRKHSPLRPAEDAYIFDTSAASLDEVVAHLTSYAKDRLGL